MDIVELMHKPLCIKEGDCEHELRIKKEAIMASRVAKFHRAACDTQRRLASEARASARKAEEDANQAMLLAQTLLYDSVAAETVAEDTALFVKKFEEDAERAASVVYEYYKKSDS